MSLQACSSLSQLRFSSLFLVAANIKSLPALNMILRAQEEGQITSETHTLVEYSSGSTITSIGLIANILGIPKVKAYVTNKTTVVKLQLLRFFVSFDSPANEYFSC
jgi:cysteine synthase A